MLTFTFTFNTEKERGGKENGGEPIKVIMVYLYIFGTPFDIYEL